MQTQSVEISIERQSDVITAKASGRIDGANAREFQDILETAIQKSDRGVILDLEQLSYISSAGLRVILLMARALQRQDANLAVCSLSGPIREVFEISGFDKIITTLATHDEAIATFAS